jgi:hypothetical protein
LAVENAPLMKMDQAGGLAQQLGLRQQIACLQDVEQKPQEASGPTRRVVRNQLLRRIASAPTQEVRESQVIENNGENRLNPVVIVRD